MVSEKCEKAYPRIRVAGLLFKRDAILVVEHVVDEKRWLCYPGGRLEFGETPEQCLQRELLEELNLHCHVDSLAAVGYYLDESSHNVELFFRCTSDYSAMRVSSKEIGGVHFVDVNQLVEKCVFPIELSSDIPMILEKKKRILYYGGFE